MKLLKIDLENFCGIRELSLEFDGESKAVHGDNGTGKSTVANAFYWMFTNKAADGTKSFSPETLDENGEVIHFLDHAVGMKILTEEGIVTLRKTLKERSKKDKTTGKKLPNGNTTVYEIDGISVKEKDWNAYISALVSNQEVLQLFIDPGYFSREMKWQDRRAMVIELCGDVDEADVIEKLSSEKKYSTLRDILKKPGTIDQYYTIDEYKLMADASRKKMNRKKDAYPDRIDEAQKAIPEGCENIDPDSLRTSMEVVQSQIDSLEKEKKDMLMPGAKDAERAELERKLRHELEERRRQYESEAAEAKRKYKSRIETLESQIGEKDLEIKGLQRRVNNASSDLAYMAQTREQLVEEINRLFRLEFDESSNTCPTCGQLLPPEKMDEAREKFNLKKAEDISRVRQRGQNVSRDAIAEQEELINKLNSQIRELGTEMLLKREELSRVKGSYEEPVRFEDTDGFKDLNAELMAALYTGEDDKPDTSVIDKKITQLQGRMDVLREKQSNIQTARKQTERMMQLQDEFRQIAADIEELERNIWLCNEAVTEKIRMMESGISKVFGDVAFKMFEMQKNGILKECCEVMVRDSNGSLIPFANINETERINAGLLVIDILDRHYGVRLPVIIDGAESYTDRHLKVPEDMQLIRLVVDGSADKLTIR